MATDSSGVSGDAEAIPLGPFDLLAPLGRGGMGEVWRGAHRDQGLAVAVKVMTGEHAREAAYIEAFRNEVQSVAALDHPAIIYVFDQGQITAEAEAASGGVLLAGSPFLAMELCSLGSLEYFPRPLDWPHLRALLLALLEALAHAHARGVIHRDIKPENVLLAGPDDPRPGVKLSDFGLAHPAEKARRTGEGGGVAGTPLYMSPEQAMGHWRDYGPWTDLYSRGCVAWELATGSPPFIGTTPLATLAAQLQRQPPELVPLAPGGALGGLVGGPSRWGPALRFSVDGVAYRYQGNFGVTPEWLDRALTETEERWLSACLIAHVNGLGENVLISMRAEGIVGADEAERASHPVHEGAFFGSFGQARLFSCFAEEAEEAMALSPDRARRLCTDRDNVCSIESVGACESVCATYVDGYGWSDCEAGGAVYAEVMNVYLLGSGAL
jgi:serine/threonine protein kinase